HFLCFRVEQVGGGDPAEDALSQRLDHFAPFDQRFHGNAVGRAAIVFGDHQILGHVHQAPREIARVRRFQGGVGEALARPVRRDEVLQHVQPPAATTVLYRSPTDTSPDVYSDPISFTPGFTEAMRSGFLTGTSMSSTQIDRPARVAMGKPACMSLSAKITVSRSPQRRKGALMSLEISFFLSALLINSKGRPTGRISESRARPTVVRCRTSLSIFSPRGPNSASRMRTVIPACSSAFPESYARATSVTSANTMASPLALT